MTENTVAPTAPIPSIIGAYQFKKAQSHHGMARTFVAFVRVSGRKNTGGYIVFASNHPLRAFHHQNFASFWVAANRTDGDQITALLESTHQEARQRYLDENFVSAMAVNAVSGYAKGVLEDKNIPCALSFGMITVDDGEELTATVGSGDTIRGISVAGRATKCFLVGCSDVEINKAIFEAIRRRLIKGSGSRLMQAKLGKEIRKITKTKIAGVAVVPKD